MSMTLTSVVPWGRSLAEYQQMFALSDADRTGKIFGCGDGPASFNAEMTALGHTVISGDPIYIFAKEQIAHRVHETYDTIISQVKQNAQNYVWRYFQDADQLGRYRLQTMQRFLADFDQGKVANRYRVEALPTLSCADQEFDLALCSHLLFLYSEQLSFDFHRASVQELCRVAKEVRIFPLLALDCQTSPYVEPLRAYFSRIGFTVEIATVPYEFQAGGNQMMRIYARRER